MKLLIGKYFITLINKNFLEIIQIIAHKKNLIYMFQDPMTWCIENIKELPGSYFINYNKCDIMYPVVELGKT